MKEKANNYFKQLNIYIKQINSLNKEKNLIKSFPDRIDLLILCMSLIERLQTEFLSYKEYNTSLDIPELITIDYTISSYANRIYTASLQIIDILLKNDNKIIVNLFKNKGNDFISLSYKMLCISARWDIERFINLYEYDLSEEDKAFPKRKPLLKDVIFYANRMNATKLGIVFPDKIMPQRIIFAVQPNSGKSFVVNVYSVLSTMLHFIYYKTSGSLRLSNNGGNACGFSDQIKSMIEDIKISLVFPETKKYFMSGKPKILAKSTSEEWKLNDLSPKIRASYFARGRDSGINGLRIFVSLQIDDLSDGFEQINNDDAHKAMTEKFYVDMKNRKESGNIPDFIVGTMFNEFDIQNTMIRRLEEAGNLITDKKNSNIQYSRDYKVIVIRIDCYDSEGKSIAPDLISTKELHEIQENMKPYQFDLVYRQIRSSREPRIFDYDNLTTYSSLPKDISNMAIAVLDPNRKNGRDYFSLPVFRFCPSNGKYYFTNCIYKQQSLGVINDPKNEFLLKVVKFIIANNITQFTLENNTSNTLGTIIQEKLKSFSYNNCKIEEIYSSSSKGKETKLQRILSQEQTIINHIVFPEKKILKPLSDMALFMEHFTRFDSKENIGKKNNPDDAPDSVAIFSDKYLFNKMNNLTIITGISKRKIF